MPPLDRRRRRLLTPGLGIGALALVVLLVVVGGLYEVGPASGPFHRDVNRSYAAQGSILVDDSNRQGAELEGLIRDMSGLQRDALVNRLGNLGAASAHLAAAAAALAPPDPTVEGLPTALVERAAAVGDLRRAVEGLLDLQGTGVLPAATATARITAVGALLARADQRYAGVRRSFAVAAGNAHLPPSSWVVDAQAWAPGPVAALVAQLGASPTLAPSIRVVLEPSTVTFEPSTVPRVKPTGPAVVPPTTSLGVDVDVANRGNVALHGVAVSARAAPQGRGAPAAASVRVSLPPYSTLAVDLPVFAVAPRDTYVVTAAVLPPPGQTDLATTSLTYDIEVAPPTPPTTTTTTTRPSATTKPATATTRPATTTTAPPATTGAGTTPTSRPGA